MAQSYISEKGEVPGLLQAVRARLKEGVESPCSNFDEQGTATITLHGEVWTMVSNIGKGQWGWADGEFDFRFERTDQGWKIHEVELQRHW